MELNEEQNIAANHINGPCLVVAVPGSGKTRTIVERTARLVEGGADERKILSITFTNKAADEMKFRICDRLGVDRSRSFIGTFHAFCVQAIRRFGDRIGYTPKFTIADDKDQKDLINQVARRMGIKLEKGIISLVAIAINKHREAIEEDDDDLLDALQGDKTLVNIANGYVEYLHDSNMLDFSSILTEMVRLLQEEKEVADRINKRFDYVQVDEVQDTNYAQFYIAEKITAGHNNLVMVGDTDQNIFGWRGSRIENIDDYLIRHPDCKVIHLHKNYRSTPEIVKVAGKLIEHNQKRLSDKFETVNDSGTDVRCVQYYNQLDEADAISEKIRDLASNGVKYKDVAILYRMNRMSEPLEQSLTKNGIPYEVIGGRSFYDRKEIRDCLAMLRLLSNPKDGIAFHRVADLTKGIGDVTIGKIENLSQSENLSMLDACKEFTQPLKHSKIKVALSKIMEAYEDLDASTPVAKAADTLIEKFDYENCLEKYDPENSFDRIENVRQLVDSAANFSDQVDSIDRYLQVVTLVTSGDKESGDKVSLMSAHCSKGTEHIFVALVGFEQGIIPHALAIKEREDGLEEERRLAYVMMTRAKKLLHISHCKKRKQFRAKYGAFHKDCKPSQFLYEAGLLVKGRD